MSKEDKPLSKQEVGNDFIGGVTYRFIFGLIAVFFVATSSLYFAIWQGIEFIDTEWIYSEKNTIRAGQYMIHGLWGLAFATSPVWWLGIVILTFKKLVKK